MDPTRPLDNSVATADLNTPTVQRVAVTADVTSAQAKAQSSPAEVAESVAQARTVVDSAKAGVADLDMEIVAELRDAIREGRFGVEPHALAGRLLDDVFGAAE